MRADECSGPCFPCISALDSALDPTLDPADECSGPSSPCISALDQLPMHFIRVRGHAVHSVGYALDSRGVCSTLCIVLGYALDTRECHYAVDPAQVRATLSSQNECEGMGWTNREGEGIAVDPAAMRPT